MRKQLAVILVAAMALASCNNVEVVDGVKIQKHEHDDSAVKLKEGDITEEDVNKDGTTIAITSNDYKTVVNAVIKLSKNT